MTIEALHAETGKQLSITLNKLHQTCINNRLIVFLPERSTVFLRGITSPIIMFALNIIAGIWEGRFNFSVDQDGSTAAMIKMQMCKQDISNIGWLKSFRLQRSSKRILRVIKIVNRALLLTHLLAITRIDQHDALLPADKK